MESRDYLLVGVCVVAALLLFFRMAKEHKVFIGAGLLCLCYGGYHIANVYLDDGITNILGWVLRGIAVFMLIWMFTVLSNERAKNKEAQKDTAKDADELHVNDQDKISESNSVSNENDVPEEVNGQSDAQ